MIMTLMTLHDDSKQRTQRTYSSAFWVGLIPNIFWENDISGGLEEIEGSSIMHVPEPPVTTAFGLECFLDHT